MTDFSIFATALSQYASLAILSNEVKEWAQHYRKKFNLDQYFKAMVFSGDVGCCKPEPEFTMLSWRSWR